MPTAPTNPGKYAYDSPQHSLLIPPTASSTYMGADWFSSVTTGELRSTELVKVSSTDAIRMFWSDRHVAFKPLLETDVLPPLAQVMELFEQCPRQLQAGNRSVAYTLDGHRYQMSFAQIAFIRGVHNSLSQVQRFKAASQMLDVCKTGHFLSGAQHRQAMNLPAFATLSPSGITMSDLGTLAGERWVVDNVINHVLIKAQRQFPHWWLGETTFFQWLEMEDNFHRPSAVQKRDAHLRDSACDHQSPLLAGILNPSSAHWTAIAVDLRHGTVFYGHSGIGDTTPPLSVLNKLNAYFAGTTVPRLGQDRVLELPVPKQYAGHGSCGLAATIHLIRFVSNWFKVDPQMPAWRDDTSSKHRKEWFASAVQDALDYSSALQELKTANEHHTAQKNHTEIEESVPQQKISPPPPHEAEPEALSTAAAIANFRFPSPPAFVFSPPSVTLRQELDVDEVTTPHFTVDNSNFFPWSASFGQGQFFTQTLASPQLSPLTKLPPQRLSTFAIDTPSNVIPTYASPAETADSLPSPGAALATFKERAAKAQRSRLATEAAAITPSETDNTFTSTTSSTVVVVKLPKKSRSKRYDDATPSQESESASLNDSDPGKSETSSPSEVGSARSATTVGSSLHFEPSILDSDSATARPVAASASASGTGTVFRNMVEATESLLEQQRVLGYRFMRGERKKGTVNGRQRVVMQRLHCSDWKNSKAVGRNAGSATKGTKGRKGDPANQRRTKEGRHRAQRCTARINIRLEKKSGRVQISLQNLQHNHEPHYKDDEEPVRAATKEQRAYAQTLVPLPGMNRSLARSLIAEKYPSPVLSLRQVSNLIDQEKSKQNSAERKLGSDAAGLVGWLSELKDEDPRTTFQCAVDDQHQTLRRLTASSPTMAQILRQYGDVIIADASYSRNRYRLPLSIYAVIDGTGTTRNVMYAVHDREDTEAHEWVLKQLASQLPRPPEAIISDQDGAFAAAVRRIFPTTQHTLCLHHIYTNLLSNLAVPFARRWTQFQQQFWKMHRASSPEAFQLQYDALVEKYPQAREYLDDNIYPIRSQWAAAWTLATFTAGARTTGRVEGENGLTKIFANTKTTLCQLFKNLFARGEAQQLKSAEREGTKLLVTKARIHERIFHDALNLMRQHCRPFALHFIYEQMELSLGCRADSITLKAEGAATWEEFADRLTAQGEDAKDDEKEEILSMDDNIEAPGSPASVSALPHLDDPADENQSEVEARKEARYINLAYLIRNIQSIEGQQLSDLFIVDSRLNAFSAVHFVLHLNDGATTCTCGLSARFGVPCSHILAAIAEGLPFYMGNIKGRWFRESTTAPSSLPPVIVPQPRFKIISPTAICSKPPRLGKQVDVEEAAPFSRKFAFAEGMAHFKSTIDFVDGPEALGRIAAVLSDLRAELQAGRDSTIRDPVVKIKPGRASTKRLRPAYETQEGPSKQRKTSNSQSPRKSTKKETKTMKGPTRSTDTNAQETKSTTKGKGSAKKVRTTVSKSSEARTSKRK